MTEFDSPDASDPTTRATPRRPHAVDAGNIPVPRATVELISGARHGAGKEALMLDSPEYDAIPNGLDPVNDTEIEALPETAMDDACPCRGENVSITIDPCGGAHQTYVQHCPVCCRPLHVTVTRNADDSMTVALDRDD